MQFEFRKRLSNGLTFNTSYAWASAWMLQRYGFQHAAEEIPQAGQVGNVQHAVKGNWLYELPFGEGKRWGGGAGGVRQRAASAAGSSTASAASRPASSSTSATSASSACRRTSSATRSNCAWRPNGQLFILPQDIIDNTVKAFQTSARRRRTATARSARRPAATSRRPTGRTASRRRPATATAASAAWSRTRRGWCGSTSAW